MKAEIGKFVDGSLLTLDVEKLVGSHLCIQANSGGGKSGAIRRLLEVTHGRLQHIVLDVEDEFHTLREKFEYMIAGGDNGDCAATVNNAAALALMILETGYSAIVQLNDLHIDDRREFIAAFLGALIGAPKALWHPALVVLDEAQMYAPQVGVVSSSDAVVSLMTLGRKRGFTGVLAAPRIAGISKDAIGAVNNWLLGRIGQPVDRKASADALGFGSNSVEARGLIELETGQFWGYGPALCRAPALIQVGRAETTYIKAGMAPVPVPPAPAAMQRMLEKLNKAAKAAEAVPKSTVPTTGSGVKPAPDINRLQQEAHADGRQQGDAEGYARGRAEFDGLAAIVNRLTARAVSQVGDLKELRDAFGVEHESETVQRAEERILSSMSVVRDDAGIPKASDIHAKAVIAPAVERPRASAAPARKPSPTASGDGGLNSAGQKMLAVLNTNPPVRRSWTQTATLAGLKARGGHYNTGKKALLDSGLIRQDDDLISIVKPTSNASAPLKPAGLVEMWCKNLSGAAPKFLQTIFNNGGVMTQAAVAEALGMQPRGGHWNSGWKELRDNDVVVVRAGIVELTQLFQPKR